MELDVKGDQHWLDISVIGIYILGTFAVGLWTIVTGKSNLKNVFLASRSMAWWPVGMSLFASNIGANNFVGIAGSGAISGKAVVLFEWNATWLLVLLGWIFTPVYIACGIYTMPEYLQERFGGSRLRVYLSLTQLATCIFTYISADLFTGALFLQECLGGDLYLWVIVLLGLVVIFTGLGGLKTVILTDAVAVLVMVIGGFSLCIIGLDKVGGYTALEEKYMKAIPASSLTANISNKCGYPREDALRIFRDWWSADYPWLGTIVRTTVGSLWYWCANQVLVQRVLAAKDITHAKAGTLLAGFLKLSPLFIMVLPGMMSRVLYTDEVACSDPDICEKVCGIRAGCSNIALPKIVKELLPPGIRGLLISSVMASVISSLTSIFNSSSTLFTLDIWSRMRPRATERELLLVGRLFIVVLTVLSILWIPILGSAEGGEIFRFTTALTGNFGAPTCAVFVLAIFWSRANEPGVFWAMLIAQLWGLVRFMMEVTYTPPLCGEKDTRPGFLRDFNAYNFTLAQVTLAFVLATLISLCTKPVPKWKLAGLTWWTRHEKPQRDITLEAKDDEATSPLCISEPDDGDEDEKRPPSSLWQRFVVAMIGSNRKPDSNISHEPTEDYASRLASLKQSPAWRTKTNVCAFVLLLVTTLFLIFFDIY